MTKWRSSEEARNGYICGFYLSKFDMEAVRELGCEEWEDVYKKIGEILGYEINGVRNNRDRYDSFHDNIRKGWNPDKLTKPAKKIVEEFKDYDFETLSKIVKNILGVKSYTKYSEPLIQYLTPEQDKYLKQEVEKEKDRLKKERNLKEQQCVSDLCKIEGGETEVPIFDHKSIALVGLADLITDTEIIEVKNISNWKHAVGQIFAYWHYSGLKEQLQPRIHLFGGNGINDPKIELCKTLMKQVFSPYTTSTRVTYIEKINEYDQNLYAVIKQLKTIQSWGDVTNLSQGIIDKAWQFLTDEERGRLWQLSEQYKQANN